MSSSDRITSVSALARKLKPYILAWDELGTDSSRAIVVTIPGGSAGGGGGLDYHDLNGPWHTGKLDWSQINFVSSDLADVMGTMPWARIDFAGSDLDDIGGDLAWSRIDFADSDYDDIGGTLEWRRINFFGSNITDIETRNIDDLTAAGAGGRVAASTGVGTVGLETTFEDGRYDGRLLRTGTGGRLMLGILDVAQLTNDDGDITIDPYADLVLHPANDIIGMSDMRSQTFSTGLQGALIDWPEGNAEFRNLFVSSLYAEEFVALVKRAAVGSLVVAPSMALTTRSFQVKDVGETITVFVTNIPGVNDDMKAFENGDHLRIPFAEEVQSAGVGDGVVSGYWHESNTAPPSMATTYLDEDFEGYAEGDDPTDWKFSGVGNSTSDGGAGYWKIYDDGNAALSVNGVESNSNYHAHWNGSGASNLSNYRFSGRFQIGSVGAGVGFTLLSKYCDVLPSDTYVRVRRYFNGIDSADFHVAPHGYAAPDGGTTESGFSPSTDASASTGVWINFKIEVEDDGSNQTDLRAKFWEQGTSEPGSWQIDCYWNGSSRPRTGTFGFWSYNVESENALYDDILVESLGATSGTGVTVTVPSDLRDATASVAIVTHDGIGDPIPPNENWVLHQSATVGGIISHLYKRGITGGVGSPWTHNSASEMNVSIFKFASTNKTVTGEAKVWSIARTNHTALGTTLDDPSVLSEFYVFPASPDPGNVSVSNDIENFAGGEVSGIAQHYAYWETMGRGTAQAGAMATQNSVKSIVWRFEVGSNNAVDNAGAIILGSLYGTVEALEDVGEEDNEQAWELTVTRVEPVQAVGSHILPDTEVLDMGVPGDGFWEATARHPNGSAPFARIAVWDTVPWLAETKTMHGNLEGQGSALGKWGFWFGHEDKSVEFSDEIAELRNIDLVMGDGVTDWMTIDIDNGITVVVEDGNENDPEQWDDARKITWVTETGETIFSIAPYQYDYAGTRYRDFGMYANGQSDFDASVGLGSKVSSTYTAMAGVNSRWRDDSTSTERNASLHTRADSDASLAYMSANVVALKAGFASLTLEDNDVLTLIGKMDIRDLSADDAWRFEQSTSSDAIVIRDMSDNQAAFAIYPDTRYHRVFGSMWVDADGPLVVGGELTGNVWDDLLGTSVSPQIIVGSESRNGVENYLTSGMAGMSATAWGRQVIWSANAFLDMDNGTGADPFSTSVFHWRFMGQQSGSTYAGFMNFAGNSGRWRWLTGAQGRFNGEYFNGSDLVEGMILQSDGSLQIAGTMGGDWSGLTYGTNWQTLGSGYATPAVKKFGNHVFMKGLVKRVNSTSPNPSVMAYLSSDYRPAASDIFTCAYYSGGTTSAVRVNVQADGEVKSTGLLQQMVG